MNKSQIIHWVLFDLVLIGLFVGLVFETIRDGYSWLYVIGAAILIGCVNATLILEKMEKKK